MIETGLIKFYAVKMLKKSMLKQKNQAKYLNFEIEVIIKMKHWNLLEIKHIVKRDFEVLLFMEFMEGGDL